MKKIVVLDTSAILSGTINYLPFDTEIYIPQSVITEVKDANSKYRLEISMQTGRVKVMNPPIQIVNEVNRVSMSLGEALNLSQTDIEVVALALYLHKSGYSVIVFSDDYSVQNLCRRFRLKFTSVKTIGIREVRRYIYKCTACNYMSSRLPHDRKCPICGSKLKRKRVS